MIREIEKPYLRAVKCGSRPPGVCRKLLLSRRDLRFQTRPASVISFWSLRRFFLQLQKMASHTAPSTKKPAPYIHEQSRRMRRSQLAGSDHAQAERAQRAVLCARHGGCSGSLPVQLALVKLDRIFDRGGWDPSVPAKPPIRLGYGVNSPRASVLRVYAPECGFDEGPRSGQPNCGRGDAKPNRLSFDVAAPGQQANTL